MAPRGNYPSSKQDQYMIRFPDGMRDQLKEAARKHGRTLNAEIIARVAYTLGSGVHYEPMDGERFDEMFQTGPIPPPANLEDYSPQVEMSDIERELADETGKALKRILARHGISFRDLALPRAREDEDGPAS